MTVRVQEVKRVGLPRPPRTRKRKRAALIVNMHPDQLRALERRAKDASMTLAEFVSALLFDDAPDTDCPHGVPLGTTGAGACVRCDGTGRPKVESLDEFCRAVHAIAVGAEPAPVRAPAGGWSGPDDQ